MSSIIELQQLKFHWQVEKPVLAIDQLEVCAGEKLFLQGPSGCGKSTLLNLIAGIHKPVAGRIAVNGCDLNALSAAARDRFRADHIGLIFQQFNLLPYLSVQQNVLLPCHFSQLRREQACQQMGSVEAAALALLQELGLQDYLNSAVTDLSIGQQQRVAAARALIGNPRILIADEPTSSLDSDNREGFIKLLIRECDQHDITLLFVSHDRQLTSHFSRIIDLQQLNHAGAAL
ncbi:ABC transporter ATP-binding protein [Amphritea sp. 1_MG-2023]|uniref:ABC transporter ATP-binding protein n=1 Tax=Amphritea sp. 1_MG-2023 TaxID=3062670 RepID=UPI0026E408DB|nr:ABC transporter ATP-binding protein [Amphritea sp. 1_MG-2023]MDO6564326.1 ABC transporter ATP-binding protein [Amphritea sp. 1_MG-2023]